MEEAESPVIKPRRREFRKYPGNVHYVGLFNQHVTSSFSLGAADRDDYRYKSLRRQIIPQRLQASKNTASRSYYMPETNSASFRAQGPEVGEVAPHGAADTEFSALPGVFWSSTEKEVFFECLARFSIHRVDDIAAHLPQKSAMEIYAYYGLLKDQLHQVQQQQRKVKTCHHQKSHSQNYQGFDGPGNCCGQSEASLLVPYSALPIAKEMDPEWEEFEEEQSVILGEKDQTLSTHKAQSRSKQYKELIARDDCLINVAEVSRFTHLYRANTVTPTLADKMSNRLMFGSLVFLEELIRLKTRDLVGEVILGKGLGSNGDRRGSIPDSDLVDLDAETAMNPDTDDPARNPDPNGPNGSTAPHADSHTEPETDTPDDQAPADSPAHGPQPNVRKTDIWRAAERLRMYETPVAGVASRHRDGKTAVLGTYWPKVISSLKAVTVNPISLLPTDSATRYYEQCIKAPQSPDLFAYETVKTTAFGGHGNVGCYDTDEDSEGEDLVVAESEYLECIDARESSRYSKRLRKEMGLFCEDGADMPRVKRRKKDVAFDHSYARY